MKKTRKLRASQIISGAVVFGFLSMCFFVDTFLLIFAPGVILVVLFLFFMLRDFDKSLMRFQRSVRIILLFGVTFCLIWPTLCLSERYRYRTLAESETYIAGDAQDIGVRLDSPDIGWETSRRGPFTIITWFNTSLPIAKARSNCTDFYSNLGWSTAITTQSVDRTAVFCRHPTLQRTIRVDIRPADAGSRITVCWNDEHHDIE